MGLMFRSLKQSDAYFPYWQRLQRLRRPARRLFLTTIGLAAALSALALFSIAFITLAGIVLVLGLIAAVAAALRAAMWRCPRCGKRFFFSWSTGWWPWADACRRCGLPEFSPCEPADQQWETIDVSHAPSR